MGLRKGGVLVFEHLILHSQVCLCCQVKLACVRLRVSGQDRWVGMNGPLGAVTSLHIGGWFDTCTHLCHSPVRGQFAALVRAMGHIILLQQHP